MRYHPVGNTRMMAPDYVKLPPNWVKSDILSISIVAEIIRCLVISIAGRGRGHNPRGLYCPAVAG